MVKESRVRSCAKSKGSQQQTARSERRTMSGVMSRVASTSLQAAVSGSAKGFTRESVSVLHHPSSHVRKSKVLPSCSAAKKLRQRGM